MKIIFIVCLTATLSAGCTFGFVRSQPSTDEGMPIAQTTEHAGQNERLARAIQGHARYYK